MPTRDQPTSTPTHQPGDPSQPDVLAEGPVALRTRPRLPDQPWRRLVGALGLLVGAAWLAYRVSTFDDVVVWYSNLLLFAGEVVSYLAFLGFAFDAWRLPPLTRPIASSFLPAVDVIIPVYDEPVDVIRATLTGATSQDYRGRYLVWLCDDADRDELEDLAVAFGVGYLRRDGDRGAKAGNVNAALAATDGEVVTVLDSDMVAQPDYLSRTVPYLADPSVAFVQTPHDFYNRNSFQHHDHDRHEQSVFYDVLQHGKVRHDSSYWCGTGGLLRRAALDDVGGVDERTITEDFHTSVRLHAAGWSSRYHPEPLTFGLGPSDAEVFVAQRDRWGSGNIALLRHADSPLWVRGLSLRQRLSYLATLVSVLAGLRRVLFVAAISITLAMAQIPFEANPWVLVPLLLATMTTGSLSVLVLARGRMRIGDLARGELLSLPAQLSALRMLLTGTRRRGGFNITRKDGATHARRQIVLGTEGSLLLLTMVAVLGATIGVVRQLLGIGLETAAAVITITVAAWELAQLSIAWHHALGYADERARYRVQVRGRRLTALDEVGRPRTAVIEDLSASGARLRFPDGAPRVGESLTLAWKEGQNPATVVVAIGEVVGVRFDDVPVAVGREIDQICAVAGAPLPSSVRAPEDRAPVPPPPPRGTWRSVGAQRATAGAALFDAPVERAVAARASG